MRRYKHSSMSITKKIGSGTNIRSNARKAYSHRFKKSDREAFCVRGKNKQSSVL
jgi:hypothetical protein